MLRASEKETYYSITTEKKEPKGKVSKEKKPGMQVNPKQSEIGNINWPRISDPWKKHKLMDIEPTNFTSPSERSINNA